VPTFLDTNILVYAADAREPVKRQVSLGLLSWALQNREELYISPQVAFEFFAVVTRKFSPPMSPTNAATAIEGLSSLSIVPVTAEIMRSSVSLAIERQLSIWDAAIVSAASAAGCSRVLTEDLTDGQELLGIRIENPFKPGWHW
jgi:predicted nucleic acid-binding protein